MGISRKRMSETNLLIDFGPESTLTKNVVQCLYNVLENSTQLKTRGLVQDWKNIFSQFTVYDEKTLRALATLYEISGVNMKNVLFVVQTYFALLIKFFAAEIAYLYRYGEYQKSYLQELTNNYLHSKKKLKQSLEDLETSKLFHRVIKIKNFIEGSHFSWYLDEWSDELAEAIFQIAGRLSEYALILEPFKSKDLFKTMYQGLVPQSIRHKLGEFYTPDWLAQFLLDKVGFNLESFEQLARDGGDPVIPIHLKLIDPSCGSGTFLIEAVHRIRFYAEKHSLEDHLGSTLLQNIIGIDLNPLAVLAARTNYLISMQNLFPTKNDIELPVYLADAISVENSGFLTSLGPFDFLVGNPPWILWDNLPEEYRNRTKQFWKNYGLFTLKGYQAQHGGGKKDLSILFTYVCLDRYLKNSGKFSFILTQSVFKTIGAGEGFRKFRVNGRPYRVIEVHDFTDIRPFKEANNKTTVLVLEGGQKTTYPVDYLVWKEQKSFDRKAPWSHVKKAINPIRLVASPSISTNILSPWITVPKDVLPIIKKISGHGAYSAREGINSGGLNGVYWVEPQEIYSKSPRTVPMEEDLKNLLNLNKVSNTLVVQNITTGMKKKVKRIIIRIEDFFVYPLLKSRNVEKWRINQYRYALQMQDPIKRKGYDEDWVKTNFPLTYTYLKEFETELKGRKSKVVKRLIERGPFYSMYAVGEYTYSKYKVVWSQMGSKLMACVVSKVQDKYVGNKLLLPEHVLAFIPIADETEAHYVCAILNSNIADLVLRGIARGTKSFGTPRLVEKTIRITKFDPSNQLHRTLANLSSDAHKLALISSEKLVEIEKQIDLGVANLYRINSEEFQAIQRGLELLT